MTMPSFFRLCIVLFATARGVFGALPPNAYNSGVPIAPDGERFLFVVETSSSMEDLQSAAEATVYDVIRRGADGYMKTGDTYGLWTYNKEVYAGEFSMRVWESRKALQQATIAAAFLNQAKYEKSANIKPVMENLAKVIRAVSNLTVFVVSEGSSTSLGTPFDQTIQDDYKKLSRARRQAQRPFITTLIVRDGWFVAAKVTVAGAALSLPERLDASLAKTPPAPTNAPAAKRPPGAVLAVRDLEATNTSLTTTSALPAAATSAKANVAAAPAPRPKVMQIITKTNPPPEKVLPTPTATATAPVEPVTPPAEPAPRPQTSQPPAATTATAAAAAASAPDKSNASTTPPPATLASTIPPPTTLVPTTTAIVPPAASTPTVLVSGPKSSPVTLQVTQASPAPLPAQTTLAPSLPPAPAVAASHPVTGTNPVLVATAPPASAAHSSLLSALLPSSQPMPVAAREPSTQPPPQPAAPAPQFSGIEAVVTPPTGPGFNWMLVYGGLLLFAAGSLVFAVLRRARSPHASIITQSMERR